MERLSDNATEIINELHTERLDYASEYLPLIDAAQKLAAYEDTGLEPEEIAKLRAERDAAIKTIFKWTGCPECKHWNSTDGWCEKHDRLAGSCDGCDSPEWRGQKED